MKPHQRLVYSWNASGDQAAGGLKTIVTWTPTPRESETHIRMEQSGFRPQDEAGYRGMGGGWPRILARLEEVVSDAVSPAFSEGRIGSANLVRTTNAVCPGPVK